MITKLAWAALIAVPLFTACSTSPQAKSEDEATLAASQKKLDPDAHVAVRQFVSAHSEVMGGLGDLKASSQKMQSDVDSIKVTNQKALDTAQRALRVLEEMAARQGTGEITVFFPSGSANLENSAAERERLVRFADFLSRESRGRKILLLSIGSSSAFGNQTVNLNLAKKRSEVPLDTMDKYLVNVPHEFHKVYGTGDLHSPKGVKMKEHQRYQHTRIIAVFDTSQVPRVNEVAAR